MNTILEKYKKLIIQIATPYSTGTGFYVKGPNLIVTNEHIVRGNSEVVVEGALLKRQMAKVLFTNPKLDIALLESTAIDEMPTVLFSENDQVGIGDVVVAIGHPFGLKLTVTQGIISNTNHFEEGVGYYQHDAALNPGNSGGPLVNQTGSIVGLNSFIFQNADNMGFSLPSFQISNCIEQYMLSGNGRNGTVCINCENLVFEDTIEGQFCPFCGSKISLPNQEEDFEAVGTALHIEDILSACDHNIKLSRRGPNQWEILQGSARIQITYYEPNGLIAGDAILCELPKTNIAPVYEYLLRQNEKIEGLTLSIKGNWVVLSLIIFDRYLSFDSGLKLFGNLFQSADDFDNILVEEYNCKWIGV